MAAHDDVLLDPHALHSWEDRAEPVEEGRILSQLRLLNRVAQAAAGTLNLPHLLGFALRELDGHLPLHVTVVWLLEGGAEAECQNADAKKKCADSGLPAFRLAQTSELTVECAERLGLQQGLMLPIQQTPFADGMRTGQASHMDLSRAEERSDQLTRMLAERTARSSFAVPLRAGDRSVGILQSVCTRPTGFTNEQVQLIYLVGDLLGPAISNCQFYNRLRAAYEELRQTQNQLVQAEKMRALGELAGGMAHDFNNSLCGVLGFLELCLADKSLSPALRGYLESARTCSLDAAHTVRRVQEFARWQRHDVAVQLLDLNALVRQTVELTRHRWEGANPARENGIEVEIGTEATAWVSGSAAELREVLTNLIFNAVDAMPNGGRLTIRTRSTATDVLLTVTDTGIGMSDPVRKRIFEPFFTTKGERGNGLGLSVTFGIIQRYGGEINVDSVAGKGSTFVVRLPVGGATAMPSETPEIDFSKDSRPADNLDSAESGLDTPRSLRILVIEDEESIRRFLASGLSQLGHRPHTVPNGEEGLAAIAEEPFDVVITDFGLPGLTGAAVAKSIAQCAPGTPVLLLTGWSDQLRDEADPFEGVTEILGKPITLRALAGSLAAACPA
jgi:signal transduction histidine kinase/CheY-like chemotaxis protein